MSCSASTVFGFAITGLVTKLLIWLHMRNSASFNCASSRSSVFSATGVSAGNCCRPSVACRRDARFLISALASEMKSYSIGFAAVSSRANWLCSVRMRLKSSSVCASRASIWRRSFGAPGALPKFRSCHSRLLMSCWRMRSALRRSMGGAPVGGRWARAVPLRNIRRGIANEYLLAFCIAASRIFAG